MSVQITEADAEQLGIAPPKRKRKKPRKPFRCKHCGSIYGCLRLLDDGKTWEHHACAEAAK